MTLFSKHIKDTGVVFSINSDEVERLFENKRGIELRKNYPKLYRNFTGYIYCTKKGKYKDVEKGKVVGEFRVAGVRALRNKQDYLRLSKISHYTVDQIAEYAEGSIVYALQVEDVIKYDRGIPVTDFQRPCDENGCAECELNRRVCRAQLSRPPQSWCYVNKIGVSPKSKVVSG